MYFMDVTGLKARREIHHKAMPAGIERSDSQASGASLGSPSREGEPLFLPEFIYLPAREFYFENIPPRR